MKLRKIKDMIKSMIVAKDGSGDVKTIQEAISQVPEHNEDRVTITIKEGVYAEKLVINKPNLTLIGDGKVVITYSDYAKKVVAGKEIGTFASYSVLIAANGVIAKNIVFKNNAGSGDKMGQAVAVYADGDKLEFHNCSFLGSQDTLFTAPLPPAPLKGGTFGGPRDEVEKKVGRQYYSRCYIEGDVDFIFGSATAVFENCIIHSLNRKRSTNGYITAASTQKEQRFGYIFFDCQLTSNADANTVYLGRPWRNYAKTAFINCWMGQHIKAEGWHNWEKLEAKNTTEYVEFGSRGPGAKMDSRVKWAKILTDEEVKEYSLKNIFGVQDDWTTWELVGFKVSGS